MPLLTQTESVNQEEKKETLTNTYELPFGNPRLAPGDYINRTITDTGEVLMKIKEDVK